MWDGEVPIEKQIITQLVKKFLNLQGIRVPDHSHNSLPFDPVLSSMNPFRFSTPGFLKFPGPERLVVMSL